MPAVSIVKPPCDSCGEPSRGYGQTGSDYLCDECAVDADVVLRLWPEIVQAQIDVEEIASDSTPRRARQTRRRMSEIRGERPPDPAPGSTPIDAPDQGYTLDPFNCPCSHCCNARERAHYRHRSTL